MGTDLRNLRDDCPGHKKIINKNCCECQEDYDPSHHPNNFDCPIYNLYCQIENTFISELKKRKNSLDKEVVDIIVTNLFLRHIINPKIEKNYSEFISQVINQSLEDDFSRRNYLNLREEVCTGKANLGVGI